LEMCRFPQCTSLLKICNVLFYCCLRHCIFRYYPAIRLERRRNTTTIEGTSSIAHSVFLLEVDDADVGTLLPEGKGDGLWQTGLLQRHDAAGHVSLE